MNNRLKSSFSDLISYHQTIKDKGWQFRIRNYQKLLDILEVSNIQTEDDIKQVLLGSFKNPKSLYQKCSDIFNNKPLEELKNFKKKFESDNILMSVPWVGKSAVERLRRLNIFSLDELRKNKHLLNRSQQIGLEYYDDLILDGKPRRIDRSEIELLNSIINDDFKLLIAGSYRRCSKTCGDIDIITSDEEIISLVNFLKKQFSVVVLSQGSSKFMGLIRIKDFY